jgi:hypothetical protein
LEGCTLEFTLEKTEGMFGAQHIFTSIEIFIFAFHGFELLYLSICILFDLQARDTINKKLLIWKLWG